jgi:hypothetical protein
MITGFLTRFADMVHALSRRRWGSRWSWTGLFGGVSALLLTHASPALAQRPAAKSAASAKAAPAAESDQEAPPAAAPDVPGAPVADPSQTRRVEPIEVFKDPGAEELLDINKATPLPGAPSITQTEILRVKEMAGNPNLPADRALIDRVVRGLAGRLTDRKSIQSLLEAPKGEAPKAAAKGEAKAAARKKPEGDGGKGIQEATSNLLEPIFLARGAKNEPFLREYRRSLMMYLPPLLKNHLVPRVQAMIVLGQAGSPESLTLFQNEIASKSQALWVKLWALEGISNIKKNGAPLTADVESRASRAISEFLKQKDLPWPIQLRGLEAMGWLRQGALPTDPSRAHMANAAMGFLADPDTKVEVRSEAARALGLMQVNAVPKYNFRLVAYAAGQLAADLAAEINNQFSDSPPRAENPTKARYLTALLVGPVYQSFEGVQGESGSGLLQIASRDADSLKYIRQVMDQVKQLAQASVDLLGSPSKEYKPKKQELARRIAALRAFLQRNPPPSRRLVDKGPEFGTGAGGDAAGARLRASEQPLAQQTRRGR